MPEILIHRCTLRVIRRAGWSWGPSPGSVAEEAVRVLPELLAKKLSELLPDDDTREMSAPIRIRLPIRMTELAGDFSVSSEAAAAAVGAGALSPLDQRVESALRLAFGIDQRESATAQASVHDNYLSPTFTKAVFPRTPRESGALARLIFAWREQGLLERCLCALKQQELETWLNRLWEASTATAASTPDAILERRIEEMVQARLRSTPVTGSGELLRSRLLIASEIAAQLSLPLVHFPLWRVLDQLLPMQGAHLRHPQGAPASQEGTSVQDPSPRRDSRIDAVPDAAVAGSAAPTPIFEQVTAAWDLKIGCATPFLILGPLARLGYFAALDAVLEAANLSDDAPLFAAALAYKVLDPPQRGWRRSPASEAAAAAFAGRQKPVSEESLVEFSRRMALHTGALDLVLTEALIAGYTPGDAVTLQRVGAENSGGFLILESRGCFPIAWSPDSTSLLSMFGRLKSPIVLISEDAADKGLLLELDSAGVTFVTGLPPARGEQWQRITQGSTPLGWTNSRDTVSEPLRRTAREMPQALDEAQSLLRELVLARPGVVRPPAPELERTLTMAAGIAMGVVAWRLWQIRGRTSPQQVLERFGDLEGRIGFGEGSVKVRLPLGRRHQELRDAGLLATVADIPWLGRRRIEFGGDV